MIVHDLGTMGYGEAFELQERLLSQVRGGQEEALLLLEHTPVYTIGAGGSLDNLLDPTLDVNRVNRGGDITYHGPGQLMGYPIIDLASRGRDLHRYLRFLEELLVEVSEALGVTGFTCAGRTGVWTTRGKLASIGVGVRRWVSMHGFCLNVSPDTSPFQHINPCGMAGCPITSLALERGAEPAMAEVKELVVSRFAPLLEERLPRCQHP
ncbi:lipoyl(octanoyl) transferase LipB [Geomonas sp.]|uniref:lipoyl(octanoyl) transferase LipB n=1 Tax=Geomonas sp. TaxID=2651584 RepID=UPI002B49B844|nr:lipoyl(octanoyl) transferase LipB [Geomonas sp.]HJV34236.1 lipoyl(octanoyl) transferase LipB [Geomonas sp.]